MRKHPVLAAYLVAITVLAVTGYLLIATAEDASIGGGFALLLLTGVGLPFSALPLLAFDSLSSVLPVTLMWALAAANGLLVAWWMSRRRGAASI